MRLGSEGVLTFHYFYRNSYYKGVKATWFPDAVQDRAWSVDLDNARDTNPGWNLLAAATPQGRVLGGGRPAERDEAAEEDDLDVGFSLVRARHGPFLQGGVVF